MRQIGSQSRELLSETDYEVVGNRLDESHGRSVILRDKTTGKHELWVPNDSCASYVIEIEGEGHEFVRTALPGDLWWAGLDSGIIK